MFHIDYVIGAPRHDYPITRGDNTRPPRLRARAEARSHGGDLLEYLLGTGRRTAWNVYIPTASPPTMLEVYALCCAFIFSGPRTLMLTLVLPDLDTAVYHTMPAERDCVQKKK